MSGSKEGHDTENQKATCASSRLSARAAAWVALFVFSVATTACSSSSKPEPVVPIKAMSAVFYDKPDQLPKIPVHTRGATPPAPVVVAAAPTPVAPPAPPARPAPPKPTWTPPPTPKPSVRTYTYTRSYTPPEVSMPRDEVQSYARSLVGSSYEFACLAHIVERESGWNPQAINESGAYGVPQALPGAKMSSAGSDWRTNPKTQLRWMVSYLRSRYGSACNAWGFWQSHGWY